VKTKILEYDVVCRDEPFCDFAIILIVFCIRDFSGCLAIRFLFFVQYLFLTKLRKLDVKESI
jgi:hypothetical protein